jgi:hypothetical protein
MCVCATLCVCVCVRATLCVCVCNAVCVCGAGSLLAGQRTCGVHPPLTQRCARRPDVGPLGAPCMHAHDWRRGLLARTARVARSRRCCCCCGVRWCGWAAPRPGCCGGRASPLCLSAPLVLPAWVLAPHPASRSAHAWCAAARAARRGGSMAVARARAVRGRGWDAPCLRRHPVTHTGARAAAVRRAAVGGAAAPHRRPLPGPTRPARRVFFFFRGAVRCGWHTSLLLLLLLLRGTCLPLCGSRLLLLSWRAGRAAPPQACHACVHRPRRVSCSAAPHRERIALNSAHCGAAGRRVSGWASGRRRVLCCVSRGTLKLVLLPRTMRGGCVLHAHTRARVYTCACCG